MESITNAIAWLTANGESIAAIITAGLAFAAAVVKMTPTKRDDAMVARAGRLAGPVLSWLTRSKFQKTWDKEERDF